MPCVSLLHSGSPSFSSSCSHEYGPEPVGLPIPNLPPFPLFHCCCITCTRHPHNRVQGCKIVPFSTLSSCYLLMGTYLGPPHISLMKLAKKKYILTASAIFCWCQMTRLTFNLACQWWNFCWEPETQIFRSLPLTASCRVFLFFFIAFHTPYLLIWKFLTGTEHLWTCTTDLLPQCTSVADAHCTYLQ